MTLATSDDGQGLRPHHLSMTSHARTLPTLAILFAVACSSTPAVTTATPTITPAPSPTITNPAPTQATGAPTQRIASQPMLPGEVFTMTADPNMVLFFATGRSLIALTSGNRP